MLGVEQHVAPTGKGRLDAQPQVAEAGLGQDGVAQVEGGVDDDGGHGVGQDVPQNDSPVGTPHHPGRVHELHFPQREEGAANDARQAHPPEDHQDADDLPDGPLPQAGKDQEQGQAGNGEHEVGETHQQGVDEASIVSRDGADEDAGQGAQKGCRETHEEGDAPSLQQPRQDVAAQLVRPQPVGRGGRLQMLLQIDPAVAVRREPGSQQRGQGDDSQEAQRDHGQAMPAEPLPGGDARSGSRRFHGRRLPVRGESPASTETVPAPAGQGAMREHTRSM